ncbi:ABC transporter ATP-binding protein [Rhodococcus sp. NPDC003348]
MTTATLMDPVTVPTPQPMLEFRGVEKVFRNGYHAITPLDLSIEKGEIVSIVGPSGCGKTTVLRMAAGLSEVSRGQLIRRAQEQAYVFQDPTLLAWRTVQSNAELVAKLKGVPKAERRAAATAALETVGLAPFASSLPRQLSGGMKMRVSLARAITSSPEIMFFDEPFAALDEFTRAKMSEVVLDLWRMQQFSALFITHSIQEAVNIAHRVVVMAARPGRIDRIIDSPSPPRQDGGPRDLAALDALTTEISGLLAFEH